MIRTCLFSSMLLVSVHTQAAVIFSACPVPATQTDPTQGQQLVDRFRPQDFRDDVVRYSQTFPKALRYTRWLFSDDPDTSKLHDMDPEARDTGMMVEDVALLQALSEEKLDCETPTYPVAIFPFVMRVPSTSGPDQYRVRYKTCAYYVDQERQLPIENSCAVIGREKGYTFAELKARFKLLNRHIENAKNTLDAGVVGVALLSTVPLFRGLRFLKASSAASLVGAIAPVGLAYYGIREDFTDDLIRNAIDFRNANEVAITGDLSTSIQVKMPIQSFLPYFMRYLDSLN